MTPLRRLAARLRSPFFRTATLARNGPTRGSVRRLPSRVPRLENLEDRLPPGDLFGAVFTLGGLVAGVRLPLLGDGQTTEVRRSADSTLDLSASPSEVSAWLVKAEAVRNDASSLSLQPMDDTFLSSSDALTGMDSLDWPTNADFLNPQPLQAAAPGYGGMDTFNASGIAPTLSEGPGQPASALVQTGSYSGTSTILIHDSSAEAALALFASQTSAAGRSVLPTGSNQSLVVQPTLTSPAAGGTALPTQLVFQIQTGQEAALGQFRAVARASGLTLSPIGQPDVFKLDGAGADLAAMQSYLAAQPAVSMVEQPQIVHATDTNPNDPRYTDGTLWGMNGTWGIHAPQAWDTTTGSPTTVIADVDTGIDYTHQDLYENVWLNQAEIPLSRLANLTDVDGDGVISFYDLNNPINQGPGKITDLDGDGRITAADILKPMQLDASGNDTGLGGWVFAGNTRDGDTAHPNDYVGWNFVNNSNDPFDDNSHGSHTAGTIAAIGNNATGVTGVNWKASIMPLKFLNSGGSGTVANAAAAINYSVLHGARASNNSWGGPVDPMVYNAVKSAQSAGQVFVAAAGNNSANNDVSEFSPAVFTRNSSAGPALNNVIAVAAINDPTTPPSGGKASFSNFGATSVQVAGPGVNVYSTTPNNTYNPLSGTSMATPHVTGTVGLMLTQDPSLTATQIISRIVNSVTPDSRLAGLVASGGVVNAAGALEPTVKSETPAPGATNVPVNTTVQAVFTKSVQASTISFTLQDAAGNSVPATVAYDDTTHTATLTPNTTLAGSGTYTATVSGALDQFGVGMTAPVAWSFSTGTTVPTVTAKTPAAGATNVPTNSVVAATFNESVVASSITFTLRDTNGGPVPASFTYNDATHTATLTPSAALATTGTYTATVSGARDAAGNVMPSPVTWSFTTEAAPAVTSVSPAPGATGIPTAYHAFATFNKSVVASSIIFVLKDPAGNAVAATLSYSDATHTVTLAPNALLANSTTYTATVSAAQDASGNTLAAPFSWSFTTAAASSGPFSIWNNTVTPGTTDVLDLNPVELGVKFRSDVAGFITGLRYYKSANNTGTHVGNLWSSTGTLLATAIFSGETTSGWQQVTFSTPVAISANTTYVASYHTNTGHYAGDNNFFLNAGVDNAPLHALKDGADGGNGVYNYGPSSAFPNQTYQSSNYWVDVVFTTTIVPTVTSQSPAPGATGVSTATTVKAGFNESVIASSIAFTLKDSAGNSVPATVTYDDPSHSVTLTPSAALANSTTYTATVSGATDAAGHTMPSLVSWSFTTAAANSGPFSIFAPTATPANPADPDTSAVEVGVKFQSDVAGFITGIRFYKGATNTGVHVANLWASDGTLLATAMFTAESASGWQQVNFATPMAISANTTYVASYHTNVGHYADDQNFFTAGFDNAPLHALADGSSGGNGVFAYGSGSSFPNQTWFASNYWVDVVFSKS
jgi:subtilisin family serine protease